MKILKKDIDETGFVRCHPLDEEVDVDELLEQQDEESDEDENEDEFDNERDEDVHAISFKFGNKDNSKSESSLGSFADKFATLENDSTKDEFDEDDNDEENDEFTENVDDENEDQNSSVSMEDIQVLNSSKLDELLGTTSEENTETTTNIEPVKPKLKFNLDSSKPKTIKFNLKKNNE